MADLKISALNSLAGADLVAADVVAVVDDSASETKKLTVSDLIANGTTLISDATIPSAKILFSAGAIDTAELAASSVETAKINDSAVTAAKLADNSSVTLVSTLPASGSFVGQVALDTDDSKIHVWSGSAWTSVKGAGSINVVNGSTTGEINIVTSTSGDTVTVSATLDNTTAAAQFLAGPTGAGGTVGYRAIIGTDLPTASTTAKGGVIVNGNGLTMSSDTIAIDNTVTAETSENHIVQYDANGLITGGRAIVAADVPNATSTTIGVIKPGSGLGVTGAGELNHNNSVTAGTASKVTFDTEGHITGTESLVAADIPDLDADKITTGTVPTARIASDAVTADKLADRSTATIAETTPAGGAFIGQCHLNSITGDYFLWDGNVWQPIGISVGEIILAGTYDASTNLMATVTAEGTALSYVVGSALPAASASNKGYYVVVSTAGTGTSPAPTVSLNPPDFLLSTGTVYTEIDVSGTVTAQQAENVAFTAAGNIAATNVQAAIEELDTEKVAAASPSLTGTVSIGTGGTIQFEGATANDFESTLTVVDPTADRTLSLPNVSGTLVSSGDTGTVTSTMIADGTIVNADINASAEIAVSKLANGTARQLLQTDVAGSGVEFTSNVDVPGTFDCTGAGTFDSTLAVTGATTVTGVINADGKVKFPAGTASAPSFYSGTDTNTGLYFSAADEISVATGGTQRVVVDSSGRLLVGPSSTSTAGSVVIQGNSVGSSSYGLVRLTKGSTTPADGDTLGLVAFGDSSHSTAAQISCQRDGGTWTSGSSQPTRILFNTAPNGSSGSSERLRIDSSGNVGINTSAPETKLHVNGEVQSGSNPYSSGSYGVKLENLGRISVRRAGATDITFASYPASGSTPNVTIFGNGNATFAGEVNIGGYNGSSTTTNGVLLGSVGGVFSQLPASDGGSGVLFQGMRGNTYTSRITSNGTATFAGNVAISNTSPGSYDSSANNLVVGSASGDEGITIAAGTSSSSTINFADGTSGSAAYTGRILYQHSANALTFHTNGGIERFRIDSSGDLGLGVSSPNNVGSMRTLHIKGPSSQGAAIRLQADGDTPDSSDAQIYKNSAALYLRVDGTDPLIAYLNGNERFRIDSSGKTGINIDNPGSYNGSGNTLVVGDTTTNAGMTIVSNPANNGHIFFADGTGSDSYRGIIKYEHGNDAMAFNTAETERLRITSGGLVKIPDSGKFICGSDDDLEIFHNGSNTKIVNGTGRIDIETGTGNIDLLGKDGTEAMAKFIPDGAVELYHNNSKKIETTSSGVTVTGTVTDSIGPLRRVGITAVSATGNLSANDAGKLLRSTGTITLTIPSGTFTAGDMISVFNVGTGTITIAQGSSTTLYNSADASTGNRTLAAKGLATIACTASNEFIISGSQLT